MTFDNGGGGGDNEKTKINRSTPADIARKIWGTLRTCAFADSLLSHLQISRESIYKNNPNSLINKLDVD